MVPAASIVDVTFKKDGKVVARSIYSGKDGGPSTDRSVYWKLLSKKPMFGSDVTVKPDKPGGKLATLKGKIEVSIMIRNQFNKGVAKTDKLELIRKSADSDAWYLSKAELERIEALIVGGDDKKRKDDSDDKEREKKKKPAATADLINRRAKKVLEAGRVAGTLPDGVTVRVCADLFHSVPLDPEERRKEEKQGIRHEERLEESWEFPGGQVHRLVWQEGDAGSGWHRAASRDFDSGRLCTQLLDGELLTIELGEGEGDTAMYVGTNFDLGGRSVEVLQDGEMLIVVGEHCTFGGYPESDARAFAALYESLAGQARAAFVAPHDTGR